MQLKYLNTFFDMKVKQTNLNTGLGNDFWCNIELTIFNDDFKYEISKDILTLNEVKKIIEFLEKGEIGELTFIKNYIVLKYNEGLEFKIILEKNKNYVVYFDQNEITNLINLLKNQTT